ncbi:hypothetical protein LTR95_010809 [Oleoguttula sp. CCFEE 5521]
MDIPNDAFIEAVRDIMAANFLKIARPLEQNQALQQAGDSAFGFSVAYKFLATNTWRCDPPMGCGASFTIHGKHGMASAYMRGTSTSPRCPCCGGATVKAEAEASDKATEVRTVEDMFENGSWGGEAIFCR